MSEVLISIIVPNYNHSKYLKQRLDSIFNQTYQNFEVILLDDSSTDDSCKILEKYSNHLKVSHYIVNETNSGSPFFQWKKGIGLAKGKYIWVAESDDFCSPSFLELLVQATKKFPEANIFASNLTITDEKNNILEKKTRYGEKVWDGETVISLHFTRGNYLWNASAVIFKSQATDFVDWTIIEKMRFCGDWLFYVMLLNNGGLVTIPDYLSYFRTHPKTVSNSSDAEYLKFYEGLEVVRYILKVEKLSKYQKFKLAFWWFNSLKQSNLNNEQISIISKHMLKIFGWYFLITVTRYHIRSCKTILKL